MLDLAFLLVIREGDVRAHTRAARQRHLFLVQRRDLDDRFAPLAKDDFERELASEPQRSLCTGKRGGSNNIIVWLLPQKTLINDPSLLIIRN